MLEENKIMADALRKIGEIAVPPDAKLRDWKDAFAEAQRVTMRSNGLQKSLASFAERSPPT